MPKSMPASCNFRSLRASIQPTALSNQFGRRMHIPLRNRDRAVPHQLHYSECIGPRFAKPTSEGVAKRMGNGKHVLCQL